MRAAPLLTLTFILALQTGGGEVIREVAKMMKDSEDPVELASQLLRGTDYYTMKELYDFMYDVLDAAKEEELDSYLDAQRRHFARPQYGHAKRELERDFKILMKSLRD